MWIKIAGPKLVKLGDGCVISIASTDQGHFISATVPQIVLAFIPVGAVEPGAIVEIIWRAATGGQHPADLSEYDTVAPKRQARFS